MAILVRPLPEESALVITYNRPVNLDQDVASVRQQIAGLAAHAGPEMAVIHDLRQMGDNAGGLVSALAGVLRPGDGFPDPARIRTLIVGRGASLQLAASTIEHIRLAGQTAIFETPEKAMAALHRR